MVRSQAANPVACVRLAVMLGVMFGCLGDEMGGVRQMTVGRVRVMSAFSIESDS
ncbi:MAG: hypothetical protein Q8M19_21875 [Reyranella sp.]|nr:hypothetical protein [Reyranella sp.]